VLDVGAAVITPGSGSGLSSGSIAITTLAQPASVNLSTEGTLDYFFATAFTDVPSSTATAVHSKVAGGWIWKSFAWVYGGNSMSSDSGSAGYGLSTTAPDDIASTVASSSAAYQRMFSLASPSSGWGYSLRVPATNTQRVLRIYHYNFHSVFTVTASLADGSASNATASLDCTAGPFGDGNTWGGIIKITFNSMIAGDLIVKVINASRTSTDPNVIFKAATLSTV
jgi:hypothetical protein